MLHMEPWVKSVKITLSSELQKSAYKLLPINLKNAGTFPEITDKVHAMGKVFAYKLGVGQQEEKKQPEAKRQRNSKEKQWTVQKKELDQSVKGRKTTNYGIAKQTKWQPVSFST